MDTPHGIHVEVAEHHLTWVHTQNRAALLPVDVVAI